MDMQKTGRLIRRLREEAGITQKALAQELHVTDKAVSKWERGLSCPDVALLSPLAERLGIGVEELLQGEQDGCFSEDRVNGEADKTVTRVSSGQKKSAVQKYAFLIVTESFLISGIICGICNLAVSGAFTWSLYPITALVFVWFVLLPLLRHGAKGIRECMVFLSVSILPFLFCLDFLLSKPALFLPIAIRMTFIGLVFLWGVYLLFHVLAQRKARALALSVLLAIFVCLAVNLSLHRLIQIPFFDGWDALTILILSAIYIFLSLFDRKTVSPPVDKAKKPG